MSQEGLPKVAQQRADGNLKGRYFKASDGDPTKLQCIICSTKFQAYNYSILWTHLSSHGIMRHSNAKVNKTNNANTIDGIPGRSGRDAKFAQANTPDKTPKCLDLYETSKDQQQKSIMTLTADRLRSNNLNNYKDFRRNLDLLDYDDYNIPSTKPLPANSASKNFMSRLNQLSIPVTRKLKFWNKKSFQVNQYDPSFKVIYLGNLGMQICSKDESCLDKPLSTLWNNYLVNMKTEIVMRLTICNSGLKAITRQHGLTQYWSNRLVYCCAHKNYPRIFAWIYRHEGKKMRQELRCHAVFCPSPDKATKIATLLNQRLCHALQEFKREKKSRGPSSISDNNPQSHMLPRTIPLRRLILAKGSANFRPPLERSKSAPKLTSIVEEDHDLLEEIEAEELEQKGLDTYLVDQYVRELLTYQNCESDNEEDKAPENYEDEDVIDSQRGDTTSLNTTANEETSNHSSYHFDVTIGDSISLDRRTLENRSYKSNSTTPPPSSSSTDTRNLPTNAARSNQRASERLAEVPDHTLEVSRGHHNSTTLKSTSANNHPKQIITNASENPLRLQPTTLVQDQDGSDKSCDSSRKLASNESPMNNIVPKNGMPAIHADIARRTPNRSDEINTPAETSDDSETQNILLSWSNNLVIK